MSRWAGEDGFVTAEWSLAVALLVLPILLLSAQLPGWVSTREAAIVAAREASRAAAHHTDPGAAAATAERTARRVLAARGVVDPGRVDVRVAAVGLQRGARSGSVHVIVAVTLPARGIPLLGAVPLTTVRGSHRRDVEPYRSR